MVLLDTCALLWVASGRSKLSSNALEHIERAAGSRFVSAISAFEIGVKHAKGQLELSQAPSEWFALALEHYGIQPLPVKWQIAALSTSLPRHHNDPADRIIIATAMIHDLAVVSPDIMFREYGVRVIW